MATWRATQKANRRAALMQSSARLFAERGFNSVSTVELGEAVGMSGPALYNYFPSKEALLCELLIDVSTRLLAGCLEIVGDERGPEETLDELIGFHVEFATTEPDIILLQDRELSSLPSDANRKVRRLQREYLREWQEVLQALRPEFGEAEAQTRLLAMVGLLNSTPHSARASGHRATGAQAAAILGAMARAALTAPLSAPLTGSFTAPQTEAH
jgi:AcrR family transcriptional regulator